MSAPSSTERCGQCGEQYCHEYDDYGQPIHDECTGYQRIDHVKWSGHAIDAARTRLSREDRTAVVDMIVSGALAATSAPLVGDERGAIRVGGCWVVVKRDDRDRFMVTILTFLGADAVFGARRDTRILTVRHPRRSLC